MGIRAIRAIQHPVQVTFFENGTKIHPQNHIQTFEIPHFSNTIIKIARTALGTSFDFFSLIDPSKILVTS